MSDVRPDYYGGADNPYEVWKVLDAWGLDKDFYLGNVVKYVARAGKKDPTRVVEDLDKAVTYLKAKLQRLRQEAALVQGIAERSGPPETFELCACGHTLEHHFAAAPPGVPPCKLFRCACTGFTLVEDAVIVEDEPEDEAATPAPHLANGSPLTEAILQETLITRCSGCGHSIGAHTELACRGTIGGPACSCRGLVVPVSP